MAMAGYMHWTYRAPPAYRVSQEVHMRASDVQPTESLRHGTYLCLNVPAGAQRAAAGAAVPPLAARLGRRNEFEPGDGHPPDANAFLRRLVATPGHIADDSVLGADAVVHVAYAST